MRKLMGALVVAAALLGARVAALDEEAKAAPKAEAPVMLLNITSSATDDPHAVTMALQLAGHALDDGREAVLFFNVRGVGVPTNSLPDDLAFRAEPIKTLLKGLLSRGAEVHVCPHCMHALGIAVEDLVPGAIVTDREKLFSKLTSGTVVFSY